MTDTELARLKSLLSEHPDWGRRRIAKHFGWGEKKTRNAIARSKGLKKPSGGQPQKPKPSDESLTFEERGNRGELTSVSRSIRTLDDLLAYAEVDRTIWEVDRYVVNKWDLGYVESSGEAKALPLYQIKAWLKRNVAVEHSRQLIGEMLKAFREEAPVRPAVRYKKRDDGCLLEVSIFDLHLGKLCWGPESGTNYDSKIACSGFNDALEALLQRSAGIPVSRILFPVGSDLLNVDGMANETTAGTPQREDGRWQKSFVASRKLMVDAINRLREIAPVDVVVVPGNHDRERAFYLGDSLSGWFSRTGGVNVNNAPTLRKYFQFGKNLIGLTHGNEEKLHNLPLIMATEEPKMWAETRFREFHCGHWHHKKDIHFQPTQEFNGIRVRLIPSLCPADDWHRMKGYEGLRAAEAYVWDATQGCVASFSYSPPEDSEGE
jgi:hypothetical protein